MPGTIRTNYMSLQRGGQIIASHLPCRMDPVNIPLELMGQRNIPADLWDLRVLNRMTPLPVRGDYFIDEADGVTAYAVYGHVDAKVNRVSCRVTRPAGVTP